MDWFTVIPTKDRPNELLALLDSLTVNGVADPSKLLIINNGKSLPGWAHVKATVMADTDSRPHIYRQWNWGLDWAFRVADGKPHAVAVLNDDVKLPPNFAAKMIQCLRDTEVTIAFPDQGPGITNRPPGHGLEWHHKRITGYAFVVNGAHGIRCDENFKWWYGDDDLDWQARRDFQGTWEVDVTVKHLYPSESTNASPERLAQASADRETFIRKWGKPPW